METDSELEPRDYTVPTHLIWPFRAYLKSKKIEVQEFFSMKKYVFRIYASTEGHRNIRVLLNSTDIESRKIRFRTKKSKEIVLEVDMWKDLIYENYEKGRFFSRLTVIGDRSKLDQFEKLCRELRLL